MKIVAVKIDTQLGYEDVIETIIEIHPDCISMLGYNSILSENDKNIVSTEIYSENIEDAKKNEIFIKEKLNELNITNNTSLRELEEDNYLHAYQEFLKPIKIGEITIIPASKSNYPELDNKNNIFIAKQYAFGTGIHETTMLAMEMLYEYSKKHNIENNSIIDVGCGSGILSLMAKLLGSNNITAIDNDLAAVNCTLDNMKYNEIVLNRVEENTASSLVNENQKYDIVIANIETDILIEIMTYLVKLSNSSIILSGILKIKFDNMNTEIEKYNNINIILKKEKNEWMSLLLSVN